MICPDLQLRNSYFNFFVSLYFFLLGRRVKVELQLKMISKIQLIGNKEVTLLVKLNR